MATKTVGTLIKEARTNAGLTQEQLARKIKGVSANDISKAERGELDLSQAVLKEIAKATGVTQSSLINAAKKSTSSKKKTTSTSSKKKTTTTTSTSLKLTATEKKLVELYRGADSKTKKAVMNKLQGKTSDSQEVLENLITNAFDIISSGKKEMPEGESEEIPENAIPFSVNQ